MHDINWWLMALAFVLGLVWTFLFAIRRVKGEVPVSQSRAGLSPWHKGHHPGAPGVAAAGAAAAGGAAARLTERSSAGKGPTGEEPYGAGSARAGADGSGPAGYNVKGNEDSMLYHTPESPWYEQTIAEVWFKDAESAVRAGFTRWDKGHPGGRDVAAAGMTAGGAAAAGAAAKSVPGRTSPDEPYGAGSARAGVGGSGPAGYTVKGNENSMLYHTPESRWYKETTADFIWFKDEESAIQAGFTRWDQAHHRN